MDNQLNDAQRQAVNYDGGHLLMVAGPGTGKTHALTCRIARAIPVLGPAENILAITFTNRAAQQMKDRLMALGVPQGKTFVGTFHSFCLSLLRAYWRNTPLPKDFTVVSPTDVAGFDKASLERISQMKSSRLAVDPDPEHKAYQKTLRQNGWIDFDDILRETLDLLEAEAVAAEIRAQYRHVFVDEYQDINIVQNALLKMLVGETGLVTAIGDPNQAIYSFRGSDVKLFDRFSEDFPGARTMYLKENYRSSPNLLAASVGMITQKQQGAGGKVSDSPVALICRVYSEGKLVLHQADTDRGEADFVANQIEKMVGGMDMRSARGTALRSFGDIAILYRLNAQATAVAQALDHLGIPYQVASKPPKPAVYSDEAVLGQQEEELDYAVEKVSLMTLHAAKGLEFPVVFIVGCEDRLLPLDMEGLRGDREEERRLFYVGMTRAKQCLYLTYAQRRQLYGKTLFNAPSPFLSDIQEELKSYSAARTPKKIPKPGIADGQMKLFE